MSNSNNNNQYISTSTLPPPPPYASTAPTSVNNHQTTSTGNEERNDISTMYYSSIDMIRAAHYDPKNPFAFTAEQLSTLVEKRDLKFLNDIGGILGMAKGLHSDIMQGIAENERYLLRSIALNDLASAASTCNKSTTSDDDDSDENDEDILDEDVLAYCTVEEYEKYYNGKKNVDDDDSGDEKEMHRQRKLVFGKNILPCIRHKSLWRLIWLALQDKTLVNKLKKEGYILVGKGKGRKIKANAIYKKKRKVRGKRTRVIGILTHIHTHTHIYIYIRAYKFLILIRYF